jgi:hypothetical protein
LQKRKKKKKKKKKRWTFEQLRNLWLAAWPYTSSCELTNLDPCSWGEGSLPLPLGVLGHLPTAPMQTVFIGPQAPVQECNQARLVAGRPCPPEVIMSRRKPWAAWKSGLRNAESVLPPGLRNRSCRCQASEKELGSQLCLSPEGTKVLLFPGHIGTHVTGPVKWMPGMREWRKTWPEPQSDISNGMGGRCGNWHCQGHPFLPRMPQLQSPHLNFLQETLTPSSLCYLLLYFIDLKNAPLTVPSCPIQHPPQF